LDIIFTTLVLTVITKKTIEHQKIREFEKRLMITCVFGAGEGN